MTYDLDDALGRLASAPVHKGLSEIEDQVLFRVATRRQFSPGSSARALALTGFVAIGLGIASVGLPAQVAEASPMLSLFGPMMSLAPSTLLGPAR